MLRVLTWGVACEDMPAALDVNWEEVKMLAISIGVREAARRMELSEDAVRQRSSREGWLANLPRSQPLPPSMVRPVTNVTTGSNALANAMREDATEARASVLRTARRAVARVERCDDDELIVPEVATVLNQHTKTLSMAGGWNAQTGTARINLQITGDIRAQEMPPTLDAEWSEDAPSLNVEDY